MVQSVFSKVYGGFLTVLLLLTYLFPGRNPIPITHNSDPGTAFPSSCYISYTLLATACLKA